MEKINTILLVDDNKTTLQLNKWLLEDFFPSDDIHTRSSGQEAISFIKKCYDESSNQKPCFPLLIFCDVYMPDISGWDLLEFLKSAEGIDKEKVFLVLLSAYVHAADAEITCSDENVTCINKPLMDENIEMVKSKFDLVF